MMASSVSDGADLGLPRRADRGHRDHVDFRPDPLRARDRLGGERAQDRLEPVVARVVQMVGLSRREQDRSIADGKIEARDEERPARKARMTSVSAFSRSLSAAGPEFSADSASTSTIWRSSRAKWSRKNGLTT